MGGVKVTNFMGVAPKVSPELLPDTAAQIARNAKLYSGDLIPYTRPVVRTNTLRNGICRTIHALREPGTGTLKWLSWLYDVDIVVATPDNDQDLDQRYYYTGHGRPKVSNYELSFGGPPPYPYRWYDLGLPLPPDTQVLRTSYKPPEKATIASFERDSANTATLITIEPHGFRDGNLVSITGFTYKTGTYVQTNSPIQITVTATAHGFSVGGSVNLSFTSGAAIDGTYTIVTATDNTFTVTPPNNDNTSGNVQIDFRSFNATNAEVTGVRSATEFSYFSPGPSVKKTAYTSTNVSGQVVLAGNTQERKYVFTWLTPWEEESIASKPSESIYIKEGTSVTLLDIPTTKPSGNNFVRGVNIYRTLPTAVETEYFLLQTLWFPIALDTVERTGNVVTLTTYYPHNLDPEDRFRVGGCSDATFDGEFEVIDVVDQYTLTFAQTATDVAETIVTGTVYHDVSEDPIGGDPPRYWGYDTYEFLDDFDSKALTTVLTTDEYDPPPELLRGLTIIQNNILAGYVGNTVYFSEPKFPHAWPREYATVLEYNIVGLSVLNGALVVLTEGYPYIISGSDPAAGMSINKIDALFPCVARRGIVKLTNMVAYPTNDGIAVFSSSGGSQLITRYNYNDDTWKADVDPATIIAGYYNEAYFASYGNAPQAPGPTPEPTLPTGTEPSVPPAIDETPDGGTGGGTVPTTGEMLYNGEIITDEWTSGTTWWGYISYGVYGGYPAHGGVDPFLFLDGVVKLREVSFFTMLGLNRTRVKFYGYTATPVGTADEPVSIEVNGVTVVLSTATWSEYAGGWLNYEWDSDVFGLNGMPDDSRLPVIVRKAP